MLISLIVIIISQCIHLSKHHILCLKYMPFLFVNHTSITLGGGIYTQARLGEV